MSNSGSIHDIASDMGDREIKFPDGHFYAVVLSSYYGGKGYTTHKTECAAIKQSKKVGEYSHKIIDDDGREMIIYQGRLDDELVYAD